MTINPKHIDHVNHTEMLVLKGNKIFIKVNKQLMEIMIADDDSVIDVVGNQYASVADAYTQLNQPYRPLETAEPTIRSSKG